MQPKKLFIAAAIAFLVFVLTIASDPTTEDPSLARQILSIVWIVLLLWAIIALVVNRSRNKRSGKTL